MTIRYTCHSCGSKLNIKDELAGTSGKCPKCKTAFQVPSAEPEETRETPSVESASGPQPDAEPRKPQQRPRARMPEKPGTGAPETVDEDFDPVAFLMEEDDTRQGRRGAPPLSDDEIPAMLELDVTEEQSPRRRTRPRRRVNLDVDEDVSYGSASDSAGAMLSGGASAGAARDLLTRTVEESRARAARLDDDKEREPSVALMIARDLAVRGLPGLIGILILGYGFYWIANAIMGGGITLPDLGRVTGTVTLDGKPLEGATVTFHPINPEFALSESRSIQVRSSTGTTNAKGVYVLNYMEDIPGAAIGDHRVNISKQEGPRELVPAQYGPFSIERRTVESGSNEFDFPLVSDTQR